jgi:stage II sporulation protein D
MRRTFSSLICGLVVLLVGVPAGAQTEDAPDRIAARSVVFEPAASVRTTVGERVYAGALTILGHGGGLALVEETTVENYLLGIREVPFSWPDEALAAQVVAARTYLAWSLARGRSSNGRTFDYDICATTACQVYSGVGGLSGPDGERWRRAVSRTSGELLLWQGRPVQALYSSTSDGRTRNVEDVYVGSSPVPYLRAVPSPGETSPFVEWEFTLSRRQAIAMFSHAGMLRGVLVDVTSNRTADGDGPWTVTVHGTDGSETLDTWTLRTRLNRAAADLYPGVFPVQRPGSESRYPQTIMSPNYSIESELHVARPEDGPMGLERRFRITGGGWGHLVGMSQYGAEAMARGGSGYADILAHYYGGVRPVPSDIMPDRIRVGLHTEAAELEITPAGPLRVVIDGDEISDGELGTWRVVWDGGTAIVEPPQGLGLPPRLSGWQTFFDDRGDVQLVTLRSRTAAEIRVVVREGADVVDDTDWQLRDAGILAIDLAPIRGRAAVTIEVFARSPHGEASARLRILGGAE